jgi:hypothetical protein
MGFALVILGVIVSLGLSAYLRGHARQLAREKAEYQAEKAAAAAREELARAERKGAKKKRKKRKAEAKTETQGLEPGDGSRPTKWGWAKLRLAANGTTSLGVYYRDPERGASFRVVVELDAGPDDDAIREAARAAGHRGSRIVRLGPHETLYVAGLPADSLARHRETFERGESAPGCDLVLFLTAAERATYALPERPEWLDAYLGGGPS